MPLLDNYILNEIENEQNFFEIDNYLSPVPSSNDSDTLPEFISISQNCSFESINLINHSADQYNSSESTTSEIYSPNEITPPETPPSCETSSNNSQYNSTISDNVQYSFNKSIKSTSIKPKKTKNDLNKNLNSKRKLLPLAPKIKSPTITQLNNLDQQNVIYLKNFSNLNNNTLNYNLNNQNIQNKPIIINQQRSQNLKDEKLSKEEISRIKEQARKARNRQSALNSRQKKVEYLKSVEKKLEDVTDENQNLRKENNNLKEIINKLNFENNQLKNKIQSVTNNCCKYSLHNSTSNNKQGFLFTSTDTAKTKKTISLLAVIFLIGLNMNLYNDNFRSYETTKKISAVKSEDNVFKGRVLLWAENLDNFNNLSRLNNTHNNTVGCQNLMNQNETIILESKLRNWAIHQTTKQHNYILNKNFNSNFANTNKLDEDVKDRNKQPWYFIRNWNQIDENNRVDRIYKQRQIYSPDELNYEQIINSVKPKDDTYYFLSLNPTDHLILPLNFYSNNSSKNGLLRPKFSLILPTVSSQQLSSNFTDSRNHTNNKSILQLIEIDFEVINMKPIQIYKSRLNSNGNNGRLRRTVRTLDSQAKVQTSMNFKPVKSILIKNQTVQSQTNFNKTIG